MTDLYDLIAQHDQGDPDLTASAVLNAVGCPAKWRDLFGPLLAMECRRTQRKAARKIEEEVAGNHGAPGVASDAQPGIDAGAPSRSDFLATRFYTGDHYVTWGEATVEDHRNRIAYLASLRNGIDVTIQRHADAIEQIEAAGVASLNDLGTEAVAA